MLARLTPPGIAATAASSARIACRPQLIRLTPPGIAATAADELRMTDGFVNTRLTPPGIAATAARLLGSVDLGCMPASRPPESRRLRPGMRSFTPGIARCSDRNPASRPPESRRLRLASTRLAIDADVRLTPPGIAATAAAER